MAGPDPAIQTFISLWEWMPGSRPGMEGKRNHITAPMYHGTYSFSP